MIVLPVYVYIEREISYKKIEEIEYFSRILYCVMIQLMLLNIVGLKFHYLVLNRGLTSRLLPFDFLMSSVILGVLLTQILITLAHKSSERTFHLPSYITEEESF